jgi:glycosyltransferase involved in cell wall biosynthesis
MNAYLHNNGLDKLLYYNIVVVVREPDNFCLAWARRLGVNYTTQRYVCYVDDDVVLGDDYFIPVLKKIEELERSYPTFAIEGIMHTYSPGKKEPSLYEEKTLVKGERGCTHNTTIPRETLLSWKPVYTFAFEDWHLTQHVLELGGIWLRMKSPIVTCHYHGIDTWKRTAWDVAGERMTRGMSTAQFFKRLIDHTRGLARSIFKQRELENSKIYLGRIRGTVLGYLKGNEWLNMKRGVVK